MRLWGKSSHATSAAESAKEAAESAKEADGVTPDEGLTYSAAGGGEAKFQPDATFFGSLFTFLFEEAQRPSKDPVVIRGPDLHQRMPVWMENKDVDITGRPLSDKEKEDASRWQGRYRKEFEIADAVVQVKSRRIREIDHSVLGLFHKASRWLGYESPLSEQYAREEAERRWRERLEREVVETSSKEPSPGTLFDAPRNEATRSVKTAWKVLMTSVSTGKPLTQIAEDYRPRVDFYGLDAFLDNRMALIWFWTKIGMFIGLAQGTTRAVQAITTDVQYLRASGVGVLSVLNVSAAAGVVKWGGNGALLAIAFCLGDNAVTASRRVLLPEHEVRSRPRTTLNYVGGLGLSGATVGVMPWWILNDRTLALRLSVTGVCVGGALGVAVGFLLQRLVALNLSRLDASPRHLRRYEALLLRQREWVQTEVRAAKKSAVVWW